MKNFQIFSSNNRRAVEIRIKTKIVRILGSGYENKLTPRLSRAFTVVSRTSSPSPCTSPMKPHFLWSGMLDAVIIENGGCVLDVLRNWVI